MNSRRRLCLVSLFAVLCGWSAAATGEEYPARPIDMVIGLSPGAATDIGARLIGKEAEKTLGREFVPINKPGGGGAVAAGVVANSRADGYTLLATVSATLTNVPHMESVSYKPLEDLVPVFQFGLLVPAFVVRADSPYKTMKDVIDAARKNPGKISFGIPGPGTSPDVLAQLLALREKVDIAIVPFGGSAPIIAALLGGHVTVGGVSTPSVVAQVKAGAVRAIATTGAKRADGLSEVATLVEQGYPYGTMEEMFLFAVPKGTPKPIVDKLEAAFRKAAAGNEYKTKAKTMYMYPESPLSGSRLSGWVKDQYTANGAIIKKADIGK
ncbi:MAG: tripartite tricarboxylate transporter substrate binding protein [Deltaproteobacteria bacterium]|nr:tripartite tricarboxylate transporter substrate binding protein [Deltaproteobacteria bacterium]